MQLTSSFVIRTQGRKRARIHEQWADSIAAAFFDGKNCSPYGQSGRGDVQRFPCGTRAGILRKSWRGGLIRLLLGDRYLFVNRPLRELQLHARLYANGLPVPEPLGAFWERSGPFVRGAYATVEVEDACHLLEFLETGPPDEEQILTRCGAAIRAVHDAGVIHRDLQVKNLLVAGQKVYLIDFDKAKQATRVSPLQRTRNLLRLRRSFLKNGLPESAYQQLLQGYGEWHVPSWLDALYTIKARLSDALNRR